ncbi:arrestin domain-containing protein 17-like [Hylaeus anthracinus]|uniref:arrestin domain-containing protein 17-like n=1 Tax=Hylaeus anthracinus TaxID=313031 RepID=UPI0023B97623|nr:arrestin domain-containing protein 17-like [Hylaeus anthracinus]
MPSLSTFRVVFDRPGATYIAGEAVTGTIVVDTIKEKNIRGLYFSAKGEARVRWTERTNENNRVNEQTYTNSQNYFNVQFNILSAPADDSRVRIPVGYHEYPFQFQLPNSIPSSFEHKYGYIRYTVKAVIDRPWRFDHECKAAFTVVSNLNLNSYRERCLGIDDEAQKNFYQCCCGNVGSLNIHIRVPSAGYVPGQSIITTIDYTNSSNSVEVTRFTTKLVRELKFHASSGKTKKEFADVQSNKYSGPFSNVDQVFLELRIPPVPPSSLEHCSIIDLIYYLKVVVHISGAHFKITRSYQVLIGTVPLFCPPTAPPYSEVNIQGTEAPNPVAGPSSSGLLNAPRQPLGFIMPTQGGSSSINWQIPPPSYEECMSGAENIRDHDESDFVHGADTPFAPRYPVFDYPTPTIQTK